MDIIEQPKKNIVLDASMLSTYTGCARHADLRYNGLWVPASGKSNSLESGSLCHINLEFFGHNKINGFKREQCISAGFAAMDEYYHGCKECKAHEVNESIVCERHKDPWLGCPNVPLENDKYEIGYNWIVKTMEQYYQHYINDSWKIVAVERVVSDILYEDDDIRVLWKAKIDMLIDRNDGRGIFSMDHKTMKQDRASVSNNHQFMGQCLVTNQRSMIVDKIGFQTSLKADEKFKREERSYTSDRLLEWQSFILPTWAYKFLANVESGVWEPNFNSCETKYGRCQFYEHVCSVDTGMREEAIKMHFKKGKEWNPTND